MASSSLLRCPRCHNPLRVKPRIWGKRLHNQKRAYRQEKRRWCRTCGKYILIQDAVLVSAEVSR